MGFLNDTREPEKHSSKLLITNDDFPCNHNMDYGMKSETIYE